MSKSRTADDFEYLTDEDLAKLRQLYHNPQAAVNGTPPADDDAGEPRNRRGVSPDDCRCFREQGAKGVTAREIVARNDVPWVASTVRKHRRGNCAHDPDVVGHPPIDRYRIDAVVTPDQCGQFRTWAAHGNSAVAIASQDGVDVSPSTVREHVRGDCRHDTATTGRPPITDWRTQHRVTTAQCRRFRQWAAAGESTGDIQDRDTVPQGRTAIREHIVGDCHHDAHAVDHPPLTYNAETHQWEVPDGDE